MLRRLLTASFITLLIAGALPAGVLAAAPVATPQSVETDEDTGLAITLAGTDDGGGPLTFAVVTGPAHGLLSGTEPNLTYTPAANYYGLDSFTFTANDGTEDSTPATVSITVHPVNDAPVAGDDFGPTCVDAYWQGSFAIPEDYAFGPWAPGQPCSLDANDVDVDGDSLMFHLVSPAAHGTASVTSDGSWSYTGASDYFTPPTAPLSDSFTYRVTDGQAWSAPATVKVYVAGVNDPPTFIPGASTVTVAEDSGAYSASWATDVSGGPGETDQHVSFTVSATNPGLFATPPAISEAGVLTFEPAPDRSGIVTVTVTARDDGGLENWGIAGVNPDDMADAGTFDIKVTAVNDAPAPAGTSSTTSWGLTWFINLAASDIEGDATTAFALGNPPDHGDVTIEPGPYACDGQLPNMCTAPALYTPDPGYTGPDSFTFTATDGADTSALATVSITVTDNAAPVCDDASSTGSEESPQGGNLTCLDAEDEELTYGLVAGASNGAAIVAPDGSWGYQPDTNFHGTDSFTFQATDANGTSNTATLSITVNGVNDAPVCSNASPAADNEDTDQSGTVACADADLDDLEYSVVGQPAHGSVDLDPGTGAWTYTPVAHYNGADSFTFRVSDGIVASNTATVSITVTPVNDAPVADAAAVTTAEDTAQAITLAGADVEGSPLTFTVVTQPAHGTLTGTAPALTYTPALNYHGPDTFTFKVRDGVLDSAAATVSITVTPVNDAPVCTGTMLSTDKNVPVNGAVSCTDVDGGALFLRIGTQPVRGSVAPFNTSSGAFTYTPNADAVGADSFTVIANDGSADSTPAAVEIGIANRAPVCSDAAPAPADEDADQTGTLACADPDLDDLAYIVVGQPDHGTVALDPGTGAWAYSPESNWSGADAFTAQVSDGLVTSNTATVSITVTAVNDAPVATAQAVTTAEDTANAITLAGTDAEKSPLTFTVVTQPLHGQLSGSVPNLTYTPSANYHGPDSFTFSVRDGALDSAVASVSITVTPVNDAPDARTDASGFGAVSYVPATTTTSLDVLANDTSGPKIGGVTSEPADAITITAVTGAGRGSVSILPGGKALAYDPRGCLTGEDVFSYTATDSQGLVDSATVAVTVARPGQGGLSSAPITDVPSVGLRTGASIGSTVPVRVSWCGVVKSGVKVKGYRVEQSASAGASYPTVVTSPTTSTSANRSIGTSRTYAWRVRTKDSASRTGAYRPSATTKASILQETAATNVVYGGTWRTTTTSKASGGRMRSATSTSASVTITLAAGTRQVGIVGPKGSGYGSFKVWVDGAYAGSFSERASSSSYKRVLHVRSLNPGTGHTIVLKPAGNGRVYLDAIVTLR